MREYTGIMDVAKRISSTRISEDSSAITEYQARDECWRNSGRCEVSIDGRIQDAKMVALPVVVGHVEQQESVKDCYSSCLQKKWHSNTCNSSA